MKYTIESLSKINQRFIGTHYWLKQSDVEMANELVAAIENTRTENKPQPGDIVIYTNEYGEYFSNAHIETVNDDTIYLCERANTYVSVDNEKVYCNSSGGTWKHIDIKDLKYTGSQQEKRFWHFGSCGACADGGIDFYAKVNVWKCNLSKEPFSTKTHDKYHFSYSEKKYSGYHYFLSKSGMPSNAWNTEEEFQAWLITNRAVINNNAIWTYKTIEHHLSPTEFDNLNAPEDIFLMNGSKRRCKRVYDDKNYTIHLYYVWYWDEEGEFYEKIERQNKAIKDYEVDYWENEVNTIALNELKSGKIKPLEIKFE